jgi:hypothetical protein
MNNGIIIFAHNSREVDYALMSIISGGLAKKHLGVPVSLITDKFTIEWMHTSNIFSKATEIFENIIEVEKPKTDNVRILHDGPTNKIVPFTNSNRSSAFDLSPYDRTLLLDSDFLVFSNRQNQYWNKEQSVLISSAMNEITEQRIGFADVWVSETGVPLYWATNVMFTKNAEAKAFFDLVEYIRLNYNYYSDLFRFNPTQYRNDISFSIAKHILNGFETDRNSDLPPILTTFDKDLIHSVEKDGIRFLLNPAVENHTTISYIKNTDIHIMNKQSIVRNADKLLELI